MQGVQRGLQKLIAFVRALYGIHVLLAARSLIQIHGEHHRKLEFLANIQPHACACDCETNSLACCMPVSPLPMIPLSGVLDEPIEVNSRGLPTG